MEGKIEGAGKELHHNNGLTKLQEGGEEIQLVYCGDATINEQEKEKISLVRALVEKQDPSSKVILLLIFSVLKVIN